MGTILAVLEPDPRPIESANILDLLPIYVQYGFGSTLPSAILILIDKWQLILKRLTFQTQKPLSSFDASIFLSLCWNETESDSYHQYHSWHWSPSVSHVLSLFSSLHFFFTSHYSPRREVDFVALGGAHNTRTAWLILNCKINRFSLGRRLTLTGKLTQCWRMPVRRWSPLHVIPRYRTEILGTYRSPLFDRLYWLWQSIS